MFLLKTVASANLRLSLLVRVKGRMKPNDLFAF